jgi:predicted phage tail protein
MKRKIVLHGRLKEKFGESYEMEVSTPAEAVRSLCFQLKGFRDELKTGSYYVIRGKKKIGEDKLHFGFGKVREFHLVPVLEGAKSGVGKAIGLAVLGIALIAAAVVFAPAAGLGATAFTVLGTSVTFGQVALLGGALVLAGVATLLTPTPKVNSADYNGRESADQRKSFLYNGATNTVEQGQPVPLVYGRMRVGSVVISTGIDTVQISGGDPPPAPPVSSPITQPPPKIPKTSFEAFLVAYKSYYSKFSRKPNPLLKFLKEDN